MRTIDQIGIIFCTDSLPAVPVDRVRTALERSSLDPSLARELSKRYCFTRTKNRLRDEGIIDELDESEARWTWQLSRRYREENRLGYEYQATFWYDKKSEDVGADNEPLLQRVREMFARYGGLYLPSDVGKIVRRVFDRQRGMVPLRHHGVLYFVPSANRSLMEKVAAFVGDIGGECIAAEIGSNCRSVREKALSMLVESVRNDLAAIVTEMKDLNVESGSPNALSPRKASNRWRELTEQLARVRTFAQSLSTDVKDVLAQVASSELNLALVAQTDLDVIAALAHAGRIDGVLGQIAKTAFQGPLPPLESPRVQVVEPYLDSKNHLEMPALVFVGATAFLPEA